MLYRSKRRRRNSYRLTGYAYAQAGASFLTLVTRDRRRLFGRIAGGSMVLSPIGQKGAVSSQVGQSIWQRSYHDSIIRSDESLHRIRRYIEMNPLRWRGGSWGGDEDR